jgi:hypothetical protein
MALCSLEGSPWTGEPFVLGQVVRFEGQGPSPTSQDGMLGTTRGGAVGGVVEGSVGRFETFFFGGLFKESGQLRMLGTEPEAYELLLFVDMLEFQRFGRVVEVASSHCTMAEDVMRRSRPVGLEAGRRPSRIALRNVVW